MGKREAFSGVVFVSIVLFMCGVCYAGDAQVFDQAEQLRIKGDFGKAEALYNQIIGQSSDKEYWRRAKLSVAAIREVQRKRSEVKSIYQEVLSSFSDNSKPIDILINIERIAIIQQIEAGQLEEAKQAVAAMAAKYQGRPELAFTYQTFGMICEEHDEYGFAKELYQKIVQGFPDTIQGKWAQVSISLLDVLAVMQQGNYDGAAAKMDAMKKDFAGNAYLSTAVYRIGIEFEVRGEYGRAQDIYHQIAAGEPNGQWSSWAELDIRRSGISSLIKQGRYDDAQAKLEEMKESFGGHVHLADALKGVAERYLYKASAMEADGNDTAAKANFERAAQLNEYIVAQYPNACVDISKCLYYLSISYQKTGQFNKSLAYCGQFITQYTGHYHGADVLLMELQLYKQMAQDGTLSATEAEENIKATKKKLLDEYGYSKAAEAAAGM